MANPHDKSAAVELIGSADRQKFVTTQRLEINQILHSIMRRAALVTATLKEFEDFFLTSILALDEPGDFVIIECGADRDLNNRVVTGPGLLCNTSLDKVRIQFECDHVESERAAVAK